MPSAELSDYFLFALKDQFRSARYRVRREPGSALSVLRPLAAAAEAVTSRIEATAARVRPSANPSLFSLCRSDGDLSGANFTPSVYNALQTMMRHADVEDALVAEVSIEVARRRLVNWTPRFARAKSESNGDELTRLCAQLAVELAAARPIQAIELPRDMKRKSLMLAPNPYFALGVALVLAVAATRGVAGEGELNEVIESADAAVDSCFHALVTQMRKPDPVPGLAQELAALIPFLP